MTFLPPYTAVFLLIYELFNSLAYFSMSPEVTFFYSLTSSESSRFFLRAAIAIAAAAPAISARYNPIGVLSPVLTATPADALLPDFLFGL